MARNVDGVVHAAKNPEVPVLVNFCGIARRIAAKAREVGLVLFFIIVHALHHAGPGAADDQVASLAASLGYVAIARGRANNRSVNAGQGLGGRAGLELGGIRHGGNHGTAGFGLPPCIHDGQFAAADVFMIPLPGFGVDGLTHAAKNAQAAQVVAFCPCLVHAHERADDRRCGVEYVDPEVFHNAPVPVGVRPCGHTFKHECCGPKRKRAVHTVGVAGDPPGVCRAPVHVVVAHVEAPLRGVRRVGEVAARRVHDARGLARTAAGVQQKERVIGIHGFAGKVGVQGKIVDEVVPPHVAVALHGHAVNARMLDHNHVRH